jgi:ABC-type Fe3+-hydroxamate transport system substrate-binding protein
MTANTTANTTASTTAGTTAGTTVATTAGTTAGMSVATSAGLLDALGGAHERAQGEVRIVSLVPSLTELLFDLDLGSSLVGRTGFCVHPRDGVRRVPKVGGTKDVDIAKVRAAAPTHLVVNIDENERPLVDALRGFVPNVIVTHPVEVTDNLALYRLLGRVFDRDARAAGLCAALQRELDASLALSFDEARVLYLIWRNPWMTIGAQTYIAKMLATVGLRAVAPPSGARYPQLDFDDFGADRFDAVLLSSEPYRFGPEHIAELGADPRVGNRPAMLIDAEMTSWYGSRAIAGLRYLREFRRAFDAERSHRARSSGTRNGRGRPPMKDAER